MNEKIEDLVDELAESIEELVYKKRTKEEQLNLMNGMIEDAEILILYLKRNRDMLNSNN